MKPWGLWKPEPVIVMVISGPPAVAVAGDTELIETDDDGGVGGAGGSAGSVGEGINGAEGIGFASHASEHITSGPSNLRIMCL